MFQSYFPNAGILLSGIRGRHLVERGENKQPVIYIVSMGIHTLYNTHISL